MNTSNSTIADPNCVDKWNRTGEDESRKDTMRYKKKVSAHIEERVESSRETCDGCGKDLADRESPHDATEITIEAKIGSFYPEGDARTAYDVDVCSDCFVERIVPVLRAAGFNVRERDADDDDRVWDTR
jgi:hypothetical protein